MRKRTLLLAASLSALFLSMVPAGCDPGNRQNEPASGETAVSPEAGRAAGEGDSPPVLLNWIGHWKGEDKRELLVREVKREYEFLNPDVKINLVFNKDIQGPESGYKQRTAGVILKMIETGKIDWDIVFLDVAVYELVSEALGDPSWVKKHVVDFSGVPGFLESQKEFIVTDPRYKEKVGGIFTGPFVENYIMSLWYNANVARKAGLEIKERDMTFDDFLGYAKKLHQYNKAHDSSVTFAKLSTWNRIDFLFENLFKSRFDDFQAAVEKTFSEKKKQAFLDTLEAFEELSRHQPMLNRGWESLSSDDLKRDFLFNDDALFYIGGSFMYSQFRGLDEVKSREMRPVENPIFMKANGLVGDYSPVFAVMKRSENRDRAVDFMMSWATTKNAEKWVRYTKNLTGTKGNLSRAVSEELDVFEDIYDKFIADMDEKYRGIPMLYMRAPVYVFGEDNPVSANELRNALAGILEGKVKARDYFEDVMGRFERNAP